MPPRPIPDNSVRDALLAAIAQRSDVHPHTSQRSIDGTKYISAYEVNGTVFAVDKTNAGKQPIWVVDRIAVREFLDNERLDYEVYPSERGRNHNLFKLPNFKQGRLLRVYPKTLDQALSVVSFLSVQVG